MDGNPSLLYAENKQSIDINELASRTKFSKSEIKFIYRDFKSNCPNGVLTESALVKIYSQIFSCGDCTSYAKHLFSAILQQNKKEEIYFCDFLLSLSCIRKGTMEERIRWLFNFYDTNKDGKISSIVSFYFSSKIQSRNILC